MSSQNNGKVIDPAKLPETKIFALKGTGYHYPEPEKPSHYTDYEPMHEVVYKQATEVQAQPQPE